MARDDIQGLNGVLGDFVKVTRQGFQQQLKADHRHPLQGDLECLILPLTRQGHLQIHLRMERKCTCERKKERQGQREGSWTVERGERRTKGGRGGINGGKWIE